MEALQLRDLRDGVAGSHTCAPWSQRPRYLAPLLSWGTATSASTVLPACDAAAYTRAELLLVLPFSRPAIH